jgi:preprotein translocase subunit SecG
MFNMQILAVKPGLCEGLLGTETGIPSNIAHVISIAITAIQVIVPILLIIWGMLDLGKAVMAQKEDEIKKGQQIFIRRLTAAVILFFVITIVSFVVNLFSGNGTGIMNCVNSIIQCKTSTESNPCDDVVSK